MTSEPTQKVRLLVDRSIELFEQMRCEEKEKIADALSKLMEKTKITRKQIDN